MSHPRVQTLRDTSYWRLFEDWKARVCARARMLREELLSLLDSYPQFKAHLLRYTEFAWGKLDELKNSEMVQMLDEITRLTYDTVRDRVVRI